MEEPFAGGNEGRAGETEKGRETDKQAETEK